MASGLPYQVYSMLHVIIIFASLADKLSHFKGFWVGKLRVTERT